MSRADTVTLVSVKDNTLYDASIGSLSNGAGDHFFVGNSSLNSPAITRRGLVAFDVAASVPAGATVESVRLIVHVSRSTFPGPRDTSLHRVLSDWGEGTSHAAGEEGSGAPPTPGDATWVHTFFDTQFWTNPGGDYETSPSDTQTVDAIGFYQFGSTPAMVADVQTWLDTPASNFGWILIGDESMVRTSRRFDTHENLDPNVRPMLEVDFTPPPEIVHGAPGVPFADHAFSGYVDPRCESGNPPFCNPLNQVDALNIVFNVEPFGDNAGGPVTAGNFVVTETGGGTPPNVINVTKSGTSVLVELDRVITNRQWTTVEANVFNAPGVPIPDNGNQGPGVDETDRIDVGVLPGDIDQGGRTLPLDNTRFRQMFVGGFHNPRGVDEDYADMNRDGSILPFDNSVWRINFNGWLFAILPGQP